MSKQNSDRRSAPSRQRRFLRIWLRRGLLAVVAFMLAVAIGIGVAWQWPSLWFHEGALRRGLRIVEPAGVSASWESIDLQAESRSWRVKQFGLGAGNLCVAIQSAQMRMCFERARVQANVDLVGFPPRIVEIGIVELLGGRFDLQIAETADEPSAPEPDNGAKEYRGVMGALTGEYLPRWLRAARVGELRVELEHWRIGLAPMPSAGALEGKAFLELPAAAATRSGTFRAEAKWPDGDQRASARVEARLGSKTASLRGPWGVALKADGSFPQGEPVARWSAEVDVGLLQPGLGYVISANASRKGGASTVLRAEGAISDREWRLRLDGHARQLIEGIREARVARCELDWRAQSTPGGGALAVSCPGALVLDPRVYGARVEPGDFPREFRWVARTDLSAPYPPRWDQEASGSIALEMEEWKTAMLSARARIGGRVRGVPRSFPNSWTADGDVDVAVGLRDFGGLAKRLWNGPFAIPAPLHVLRGRVEAEARGRLQWNGARGGQLISDGVPLVVRTRLAGGDQILEIDAAGAWKSSGQSVFQAGELELDVALSRVRLALPRLALAVPPRVLPDPRIRVKTRQEEAEPPRTIPSEMGGVSNGEMPVTKEDLPSLTIHARVRTPRPVELLSNLAKEPIPVSADVQWLSTDSKNPLRGKVVVGAFPVDLFRRRAQVQEVGFTFVPGQSSPDLRGRVDVKYAVQAIRIELAGTAAEPQINLVGDPPLPQDQLYATLLYGEAPENLDAQQSETVGSFQAAAARNAIGLASLFLLASTPIQSFQFDPTTNRISASLRVAEGTALNVGTQEGVGQVGLRRRLGPRWVISTGVENLSDPAKSKFSALLEWSNRY